MMELGMMYGVSEYYLSTMKKPESKTWKSSNVSFDDLISIKPTEKIEEKKQQKEERLDTETEPKQRSQSDTDSEIIVKPDGSRVLVVTMNLRGMSSTMSLKISDPTTMPNDITKRPARNGAYSEEDMYPAVQNNIDCLG